MVTQDFALPALTPSPELLAGPSGAASAADALITAARAEADGIRAAAQAEGFQAGVAAAQGEVAAALTALEEGAHGFHALASELPAQLEEQAVELAFALAQQILGGALDVRPELVVDVVRGGLRRLVERDRVTLLVHPEDLDVVRAAVPGLLNELGGMEHCEVQAERRVARGGAMVRTADGEIDATLETKLARAREVVAEDLAEGARRRSDELADGAPASDGPAI